MKYIQSSLGIDNRAEGPIRKFDKPIKKNANKMKNLRGALSTMIPTRFPLII
jgi:hypothetical protein